MIRRHRIPSYRAQRGQTLILIFLGTLMLGGAAGGLLGGKSGAELHQRVRDVMRDQAQREQVDLTFDKIAAETRQVEAGQKGLEKEFFAALARHDATSGQLRVLTDRADALNASSRATLVDLRFDLRGKLSDAQWRAVFATPDAKP